jgi:hypothetical protein
MHASSRCTHENFTVFKYTRCGRVAFYLSHRHNSTLIYIYSQKANKTSYTNIQYTQTILNLTETSSS